MFKTSSITDQVTAHLRNQLLSGRWIEYMPGRNQLVQELGVNGSTIERAMRQLEHEGLLASQGVGKKRRVLYQQPKHTKRPLRIALMLSDSNYSASPLIVELYHQLEKQKHLPLFTEKSLSDLSQNPTRVTDHIQRTNADAWLISGGSREVLSAAIKLKIPGFALFGRHADLKIAGVRPDKSPQLVLLANKLTSLGHKRISFLCRKQLREPKKGKPLRHFLATLKEADIETGEYNCPDWKESMDGFIKVIDSLFKMTPPTALILDEAHMFHAAYHYLSQRGMKTPQDVSLICMDHDPSFVWCSPSVTHIKWDHRPIIKCITQWANDVANGKSNIKQYETSAELVNGGTIGPAKNT